MMTDRYSDQPPPDYDGGPYAAEQAQIIQHPSSGAENTIGTLGTFCALGTLGTFGTGSVQAKCHEILCSLYNKRYARALIDESGKVQAENVPKFDIFEFFACFDNLEMINPEQKQVLTNLVRSVRYRYGIGTHLVRFGTAQIDMLERIRGYVAEASGSFSNSQVYGDLGVTHPKEKMRVRAELSRLVTKKELERLDKNGQYRKVDSETTAMDFVNAVDDTLPIFWPLGIGNHAKIMPGNIVVVAGTTNAGKTGFLLNVVNDNQHNFDIHYFSSEMGPSEMKSRLKMFDRPITDWHFKAYERTDAFHDVIRPGHRKINIIDYIEISEDYWKIAGMIRKIYDKLDGAIAIIALQKNAGAEYGDGGMKSAQKARLYLSMSPNTIKFTKVKAFVDPSDNPNGKVLNYKLRSGCHFSVTRDWHYQEGKK